MRKQYLLISGIIVVGALCVASADQPKIGQVTLLPTDRILVLAPHPDDEVLGAGGIIQQAVAMHLPVKVVFLTNGDSNEWSFLLYRRHPVLIPAAVENMGLIRHDEAVAADKILGLDPSHLIFLGYPDFGTLNIWYVHWNKRPPYRSLMTRVTVVPYKNAYRPGAPYKGEEIVKDLSSILKGFQPTKIFVSHPADHNGDHMAFYLYLQVALWDQGLTNVRVYPYLIHYLAWPKPKGFHPEKLLFPPEVLAEEETWQQYHLSPAQMIKKKLALEAHKTQYFSSPRYLLSFVRFNELFGEVPALQLHLDESISIIPAQKKLKAKTEFLEELSDRQRSAFVGIDWKALRLEKDKLIVTIGLSKPLAQDVEASMYFFGYNSATPFGRMPKINVRLGVLSYSVYDQTTRLDNQVIHVDRTSNDITISVPLSLLGYPQKIITSAKTSLGNFPLDNASWVVVDLQP